MSPPERADKFKAQLWQAWDTMFKIVKTFKEIKFDLAAVEQLSDQIAANSTGLMQVQLQIDEYKDSLTQVKSVLAQDLQDQLAKLHDAIDSDTNEESKEAVMTGERVFGPLMVIAEDNKLNEVDQAI